MGKTTTLSVSITLQNLSHLKLTEQIIQIVFRDFWAFLWLKQV